MPVNTSNGAYFVYLGTFTVSGSFIGMPFDALFVGAVTGGLVIANSDTRLEGGRVLARLLMSMFLAGVFTPALTHLAAKMPILSTIDEQNLRICVAALIGAGWSWAAPILVAAVKRLLDTTVEAAEGAIKQSLALLIDRLKQKTKKPDGDKHE